MILLKSVTLSNQDIADFVEAINYTAPAQLQLQPTLKLQSLSGIGGNYLIQVFINNNLLVPDKPVFILGSIYNVRLSGRTIIVEEGDEISIQVKGNINDYNALIEASIYDVTPATTVDFVEGAVPPILAAIETSIPNLKITVKPETKVICPEGQRITKAPPALPRTVRNPKHGTPVK